MRNREECVGIEVWVVSLVRERKASHPRAHHLVAQLKGMHPRGKVWVPSKRVGVLRHLVHSELQDKGNHA